MLDHIFLWPKKGPHALVTDLIILIYIINFPNEQSDMTVIRGDPWSLRREDSIYEENNKHEPLGKVFSDGRDTKTVSNLRNYLRTIWLVESQFFGFNMFQVFVLDSFVEHTFFLFLSYDSNVFVTFQLARIKKENDLEAPGFSFLSTQKICWSSEIRRWKFTLKTELENIRKQNWFLTFKAARISSMNLLRLLTSGNRRSWSHQKQANRVRHSNETMWLCFKKHKKTKTQCAHLYLIYLIVLKNTTCFCTDNLFFFFVSLPDVFLDYMHLLASSSSFRGFSLAHL